MAAFKFALLASNYPIFFVLVLLVLTTRSRSSSGESCSTSFCGLPWLSPAIHYPFRIRGDMESDSCGYPGFEVYCNKSRNNKTLIYLPNAGEFEVKTISYYNYRKLWINDPDDCLPKRYLLQGTIDLSGSPFQLSDNLRLLKFTFFNCSNDDFHSYYPLEPIPCLGNGNGNTSVVAMMSEPNPLDPAPAVNLSGCRVISNASVPFDGFEYSLYWMGQLFTDIELQWTNPSCDHPDCDEDSNKGKIGLGLGLGIPAGTICLIAFSYLFYHSKMRMNQEAPEEAEGTELNNTNQQQQPSTLVVNAVVDIARYPKSQVEDDGGLPNPNDNVCSICLCEYQPKETMRTIPDCNHYFHAHCLEDWLKINASCPLCRNLPKSSFSISSNSVSQSSSSP